MKQLDSLESQFRNLKMGKHMKRPKIAGHVAVMEVSLQSSLGVRTRAKTLALQRLMNSPASLNATRPDVSSFSYLQLRSRRLEKVLFDTKKQQISSKQSKKCCRESPDSNYCGVNSKVRVKGSSVRSVSVVSENEVSFGENAKGSEAEENLDVGIEASFGENILECEDRDRSSRERTPCSLIRDPSTVGTPGSSTRQRTSATSNQISHADLQRTIPTASEMEEFFALAEKHQQRISMEKYNFDIVNDVPLPGRYEWVQVLH